MARGREQRDQGGAAAVEFALMFAFVLGPLIYAVIAFGFVLYEQATVTQLARTAARSAAICSGSNGATASSCDGVGQAAVTTYSPGGFGSYLVTPVSVDSSTCFAAGGSATATVQATPVLSLAVFGLNTVTGKSATPCGG